MLLSEISKLQKNVVLEAQEHALYIKIVLLFDLAWRQSDDRKEDVGCKEEPFCLQT